MHLKFLVSMHQIQLFNLLCTGGMEDERKTSVNCIDFSVFIINFRTYNSFLARDHLKE